MNLKDLVLVYSKEEEKRNEWTTNDTVKHHYRCRLCEVNCGEIGHYDQDANVKDRWLKHWTTYHAFELSILKHRTVSG